MKERTCFKPSNKTVDTLIMELNIPDGVEVTKDYVISKIKNMKNRDYSTILFERYVNSRTISKIEELHSNLYYSHLGGTCKSAVKSLRREIIEELVGIDSFPFGEYVRNSKITRRGYLSRSIKEISEYIESLEYKPSKDRDRVINGLIDIGYNIDYPKYLMKSPEYPYNLFSHIIQNDGILPSLTASEIRRIYMNEIIKNPSHNINVFIINSNRIFDQENKLLTMRQKVIASLFYRDKIRIPEISEHLDISESLIKLELRRVISIFNTEDGKSFIYDITR